MAGPQAMGRAQAINERPESHQCRGVFDSALVVAESHVLPMCSTRSVASNGCPASYQTAPHSQAAAPEPPIQGGGVVAWSSRRNCPRSRASSSRAGYWMTRSFRSSRARRNSARSLSVQTRPRGPPGCPSSISARRRIQCAGRCRIAQTMTSSTMKDTAAQASIVFIITPTSSPGQCAPATSVSNIGS